MELGNCESMMLTYVLNIKAIIDAFCACSGCHPQYNQYDRALPALKSGLFKASVIDLVGALNQDMPQLCIRQLAQVTDSGAIKEIILLDFYKIKLTIFIMPLNLLSS